MATKKAKRAAAQAKREEFMAEYRRSGLKAQAEDRERRARERDQTLKEFESSTPGVPIYLSEEAILARLLGLDNIQLNDCH